MENPTKIWMITGGTPILGNLHSYLISKENSREIQVQLVDFVGCCTSIPSPEKKFHTTSMVPNNV